MSTEISTSAERQFVVRLLDGTELRWTYDGHAYSVDSDKGLSVFVWDEGAKRRGALVASFAPGAWATIYDTGETVPARPGIEADGLSFTVNDPVLAKRLRVLAAAEGLL